MKNSIKILSALVAVLFFASSCQEEEGNPNQLEDADLISAENEAVAESAFEDVDDISYESLFYVESGGRTEVDEESPIHCATRTHNKENQTIIVDYGDGCEDKHGRVRSGKIIITYTDKIYMPGAVVVTTFEDFFCDGKQIKGVRTRTNISESLSDNLRFSIVLEGGEVIDEEGNSITREANWEVTRIRTSNPINDERIRTGNASGTNVDGLAYTVTITKAIVWKRGCMARARVMIPVEGTKVKEFEDGTSCTIDYGDGGCDNLITITKNGVSETIEMKKRKFRMKNNG